MVDGRKLKVVVADDEAAIANTLVIILNQAGYDARAVYDGRQAVEAALSLQANILLSDVCMPGFTGVEAAIELRAKLPSCKILLFSGQAGTSCVLEEANSRNHEFEVLVKPVYPTELLASLRNILAPDGKQSVSND